MGHECICLLSDKIEVPYEGNTSAEVVIIGESPGKVENDRRKPFRGPSGKLLGEELTRVGISPESVMLANAARCTIEKDALGSRQIQSVLSSCREKLEVLLKEVKPNLIILLGDIALTQVMGIKGIKKNRGRILWSEEFNAFVLPTWHPAYIKRNPNELMSFRVDLEKAARFMMNGYTEDLTGEPVWKEVDTILPILNGEFKGIRATHFSTAIDTETQGVEWWNPNSITISYSVAVSPNEGWQIYLHEECPVEDADFIIQWPRGGTKKDPILVPVGVRRVPGYERKVEELRELCRREDIKKYFMNIKYDRHRLNQLGIMELNNAPMDVALAAHTLDSELYLNTSLHRLIEHFTDYRGDYKDTFNEAQKGDMLAQIGPYREKFSRYASYDAVFTLRLAMVLKERLVSDPTSLNYYMNFVHPIETEFLYALECNGVPIDRNEIPVVAEEIDKQIDVEKQNFIKNCPMGVIEAHKENFKLSRLAILADALFDYPHKGEDRKFGYHIKPIEISKKTGMPVVDKGVRIILLDSDIPDRAHDMLMAYGRWQEMNTLKTRYLPQIRANLDANDRIHPTYSFTYTSSGRTGARNPSIQNFPKRSKAAELIRRLIVAGPGKVILERDMSMSELRWVAHVADETTMKEILNSGGDIHVRTGLEVGDIEDVTQLTVEKLKEIRQNAKAINFGFVYGMREKKFISHARTAYGVKYTMDQAKKARRVYFQLYGGLEIWHLSSRDKLIRDGYLRSVFGRKRSLPNIYSDDNMLRMEAERIGVNFEIQGPSSDYTLLGGYQAWKSGQMDPNQCIPILFNHDALFFEVDEDRLEEYDELVRQNLEHTDTSMFNLRLSVPMLSEAVVGKKLSEVKSYPFKEEDHG